MARGPGVIMSLLSSARVLAFAAAVFLFGVALIKSAQIYGFGLAIGPALATRWLVTQSAFMILFALLLVYLGRQLGAADQKVRDDLIERRQVEEALKRSEQDYRGLFEQAHDAIIVLRPEKEIVLEVNQQACQLYGFSREEFIGRSMETLSHDVPSGKMRLRETLEANLPVGFETRQFRKDGSELQLEINAAEITYHGERAILSINRDITSRKAAELALRNSELYYRLLFENNPQPMFV